MILVKDILNAVDAAAPLKTQCSWDNSGFLVGDETAEVKSIGFALDLTQATLAEARRQGVQLIVTHHPVIFHAPRNLRADSVLYALARSGIAAISVHTPWDGARGGVNDVLSDLIGLRDASPVPSAESEEPMVRVGSVDSCTGKELAKRVAAALGTTVRLADAGNEIARVAVCGGAAMELLGDAIAAGADAFVTGDLKHHEALDAVALGVTVVAAGHFETERPSLAALQKRIQAAFPELETVLLDEKNPLQFIAAKG